MAYNEHTSCPCGSKKSYINCCKVFHSGKNPDTALELMKSRFSAFVVGDVEYIINTTHEDNIEYSSDKNKWRAEIQEVINSNDFNKLEILEFIDGEQEAYVTFKVSIKQKGLDMSFSEKSRFLKIDGKWLYRSGEFLDD
jgi:SEC-C motif-containing protein